MHDKSSLTIYIITNPTVNIAGIGTCGYMDTMPRCKIEQAFNINAIAVIRLTQAVLPHMKHRKKGMILTVTSKGGRIGKIPTVPHKVGIKCSPLIS